MWKWIHTVLPPPPHLPLPLLLPLLLPLPLPPPHFTSQLYFPFPPAASVLTSGVPLPHPPTQGHTHACTSMSASASAPRLCLCFCSSRPPPPPLLFHPCASCRGSSAHRAESAPRCGQSLCCFASLLPSTHAALEWVVATTAETFSACTACFALSDIQFLASSAGQVRASEG